MTRGIEPAGRALVGARRIGEAVADHPLAARQRRADGRGEMVGPRRGEQQRLGQRRPRRAAVPDRISARISSARGEPPGSRVATARDAALLQPLHEAADLRGLAGPLPALERDEAARPAGRS